MQIKQSVMVNRPREEVWALFQDIPTIAGCMPGAELRGDNGDGTYAGVVSIKLGPFKAAFEGEVQHQPDPPPSPVRRRAAASTRRAAAVRA